MIVVREFRMNYQNGFGEIPSIEISVSMVNIRPEEVNAIRESFENGEIVAFLDKKVNGGTIKIEAPKNEPNKKIKNKEIEEKTRSAIEMLEI